MNTQPRSDEISAFLDLLGWADAQSTAVPGDASTRRYARLRLGEQRAILMDAPKVAELPSEPEGASSDMRKALGYNATARLAGPDMESFAALAKAFTARGFSAPKLYGADIDKGLLLLEDFGDPVYARVIAQDAAKEAPLYAEAVETLAALYRSTFPQILEYKDSTGKNAPWRIRDYDETALLAETDLCLDWFTQDFDRVVTKEARAEFYALWKAAFAATKRHAAGLTLRDFHAENLFWLEERAHTDRVGLIDFQDALWSHPAYDLASLIEDIRRDVSPDLAQPLLERFCDHAGLNYDADFRAAYAVMGGQRNTKLLGFPVRADLKFGKPQYRALLPRVKRHFQNSLKHPVLGDIHVWFEKHIPEALQ